jgi:peptide/nickel transport system substrate-binding protein
MESNYWTRFNRQRFGRRRVLGGVAAGGLGVAALGLVGCGDDDDDSPSGGTPTGTATGTAPANGTAQPRRRGVLTSLLSGPAPHFDVHQDQTDLTHASNTGQVYSRLLKYQTGPDVVSSHIPVGDAAESWEQIDPITYTFKLRPNVNFHDVAPVSGRPMTMEDAIYSYERQRELATNAVFLADIASWVAPDANTLTVTLRQPTGDFLLHFASTFNKIVAREVVEQYGDLRNAPAIGTGPFISKTMTPNGSEIERNPNYFIDGLPYLDGVRYVVIPDRNTQLAAFATGELKTIAVDKRESDNLRGQVRNMGELTYASPIPYGLMANTQLAPTDQIRVRQALNHAINRQQIIDLAFAGDGEFTTSVQNINREDELPEAELKELMRFDLNRSRQLLQEAGVSNWRPRMTNWHQTQAVASGELVTPTLRQAGLDPQVEITDNSRSVQTMMGQGLEIHWGAWPFFASPTLDLRTRWRSDGPWNQGTKLNDPEMDALIDRYAAEVDPEARRELLFDVQRKILDVFSYIPGVRTVQRTVYRPELKGVAWAPYLGSENLMLMWLDA